MSGRYAAGSLPCFRRKASCSSLLSTTNCFPTFPSSTEARSNTKMTFLRLLSAPSALSSGGSIL